MVKPNSTRPAVRNITDSARVLGVTREHLSRVLHGHRESRRLLRQYAALQKQDSLAA